MNANELMIGNWIMEGPEPNQIYSLDQGGVSFYKINDQRVNKTGDDIRFRPIPLTPEILGKAGFEKCTCGGWKSVRPRFHIDAHMTVEHKVKIKSVHQLQNLYFALTGTQLVIKL